MFFPLHLILIAAYLGLNLNDISVVKGGLNKVNFRVYQHLQPVATTVTFSPGTLSITQEPFLCFNPRNDGLNILSLL